MASWLPPKLPKTPKTQVSGAFQRLETGVLAVVFSRGSIGIHIIHPSGHRDNVTLGKDFGKTIGIKMD